MTRANSIFNLIEGGPEDYNQGGEANSFAAVAEGKFNNLMSGTGYTSATKSLWSYYYGNLIKNKRFPQFFEKIFKEHYGPNFQDRAFLKDEELYQTKGFILQYWNSVMNNSGLPKYGTPALVKWVTAVKKIDSALKIKVLDIPTRLDCTNYVHNDNTKTTVVTHGDVKTLGEHPTQEVIDFSNELLKHGYRCLLGHLYETNIYITNGHRLWRIIRQRGTRNVTIPYNYTLEPVQALPSDTKILTDIIKSIKIEGNPNIIVVNQPTAGSFREKEISDVLSAFNLKLDITIGEDI